MTLYTTRLLVIPNYGNSKRSDSSSSNSSYSYQNERFRTTLIVLPHGLEKRFIQTIEVKCGNFTNEPIAAAVSSRLPSNSTNDVFSGEESICEFDFLPGESYFDVRHRLLAKSNLFAVNTKDDTDADDHDSFDCLSSTIYSCDYSCTRKASSHL